MEELVSGATAIGISLSSEQTQAFEVFLRELQAWNKVMNLTAIRETPDIIKKHFIDSLTILEAIPEKAQSIIDIGTGAGFPGIPLAIMRPTIRITLVESVGKKTDFLNHIVQTLKLTNVVILNQRAEELAHVKEYREQFDVAVARAVAELRVLAEYTLPFVKKGGVLIAQKNSGDEEISTAEKAITELGGKTQKQIPIIIDGLTPRQIIVIDKMRTTPELYPRRSGLATKKPL